MITPSKYRLVYPVYLLAGLHLVALLPSASATAYQWAGGAGPASWTVAANWSPNGVPGIGDVITLYNGSVYVPTGSNIQAQKIIQYDNGVLEIQANASLTLDGGSESRRIQIPGNGASLTNYGDLFILNCMEMGVYVKYGSFVNHGNVMISDVGEFGGFEMRDNSTLINYGFMTVQNVNGGDAFHFIESTSVGYNYGTMLLQNLDDAIFGYAGTHFHNYGLFQVKNENIRNNGEYVIDGEGGLDFHNYTGAEIKGSGLIGLDAVYHTGGKISPTEDDGSPGIIDFFCTSTCSEQNLSNGIFLVDIEGTAGAGVANGHDKFTLNVQANFQNNLVFQVNLGAGYVPQAGHSFVLMTYPSKTGEPTFNLPNLPGNLFWETFVTATQIRVCISCPPPPDLDLNLLATVTNPTDLAHAGDGSGRLFLAQQNGQVRVYNLTTQTLLPGNFLDISSLVDANQQGLLGLVFHPNYQTNGFFYVNYTASNGLTQISRFTQSPPASNATVDNATELNLLTVGSPWSNHNGGDLAFGADGYLYLSLGDDNVGGDPANNAQNPQSLLGKLLRLDVDNPAGGNNYGIPPSNPFAGIQTPIDTLDEIWALGLRNPWRFSFDRSTGDLWLADVGEDSREEVNFQPANSPGGENYGWRCYEGSLPFNASGCGSMSGYDFPIFEYAANPPGDRKSITGGFVYRGGGSPALQGWYVAADFISDDFYLVRPDGSGGWTVDVQTNLPVSDIVTFGEDEDGELYAASYNGQIYRVLTSPCQLSTFFADNDGDDFGDAAETAQACIAPPGYVANDDDCDDANAAIHPGAPEICNNLDDDCSGNPEATGNTWTGAGDAVNWSNAANWSDGIVPLACQDVTIPAGFNVTVAAGVNTVGKTLDVPSMGQLQVDVSATMNIEN